MTSKRDQKVKLRHKLIKVFDLYFDFELCYTETTLILFDHELVVTY